MAALILDAGALIAIERGSRSIARLLSAAAHEGMEVRTSSACVAQVWRDPARQARLTRALAGVVEQPLDGQRARRCGMALQLSRTSDVVDAAVAELAGDEDTILTSDSRDIERVLAAIGTSARIRGV